MNMVENQNLATVSFSITAKGEMVANVTWSQNHPNMPALMATLLHSIHSGKLKGLSAEVLVDYANEHVIHQPFIKEVLGLWQEQMEEEREEPVIRPSEVFGLGRGTQ